MVPTTPNAPSPTTLAYYTDGIAWSSSEWAKAMLLFFDGIGMLVPPQEDRAFEESDEAVIAGMRDANCLRVLRPDELVDQVTAKAVVDSVTRAIEEQDWRGDGINGTLDLLYLDKMGYRASRAPFELMAQQLRERRLAVDWEHGASMAVDRRVGLLTLSVIAAHSRRRGNDLGVRLTPTTDNLKWGRRQRELREHPAMHSLAQVIQADVDQLAIDVGRVPVNELVDFRRRNIEALDRYRLGVARVARDLDSLDPEHHVTVLKERADNLQDARRAVERAGRDFWSTAGSLTFAVGGIAWTCVTGDLMGAIFGLGELGLELLGAESKPACPAELSYVVSTTQEYRPRS
ncbi:MAG: hypothetical protein JSR52_00870 [Planctomycetes bacterium]|nr:hypothetical protein [Planctomycetota bacterium]